jgi:hypothetical protein
VKKKWTLAILKRLEIYVLKCISSFFHESLHKKDVILSETPEKALSVSKKFNSEGLLIAKNLQKKCE